MSAVEHLYDAHTGEHLGPATDAQVAASDNNECGGMFLIDQDGDPVPEGGWSAGSLRAVYTL